jgi:hypothetical protein
MLCFMGCAHVTRPRHFSSKKQHAGRQKENDAEATRSRGARLVGHRFGVGNDDSPKFAARS